MKNLKSVWNSLKIFDFSFFQKISMFVKIFETVDFGQKFENLNLYQVNGNLIFVKNLWKSRP